MKKIQCAVLFMCLIQATTLFSFGKKTFFGTRSQGFDGVTEMVSWEKLMYQPDKEINYGTYAATLKYSRSSNPKKIASFLLGSETMKFTGSAVPNRGSTDILADYFGLPRDFSSIVFFTPRITNVVLDLSWFHDFEPHVPGLYCTLRAPVTHSKWDLNMNETVLPPSQSVTSGNTTIIAGGTTFFPAGYMSSARINRTALPPNVTVALQGNTTFGDMSEPLQYGKIFGRQVMNKVAELQATVGWNYNKSWYHVGLYGRLGFPTGNASRAEFLFEPIVGNMHHWDIGGGISAHAVAWRNEETDRTIALYCDAHLSHLCAATEVRSFDLTTNGPGSRYILIEQLDMPSQNLFLNGTVASYQYNGTLMPAINRTTFDTKISIGVQADVLIKMAYQHKGFECDIGYNLFARSSEKMHSRTHLTENRYALKGDAQIYGFGPNPTNTPVALNATQNKATINAGQGKVNTNFANTNADNAMFAFTTNNTPLLQLNAQDSMALNIAQVQVSGSQPPLFLTDGSIDNASALLPRALSNKLFIHINHMWNERKSFFPYCGIGAAGEFAHTSTNKNSAFSQWLLWVKAGMAY